MAVRKLWITDEPWPASEATLAAAAAAGATEILHGVPVSLAGVVDPEASGYVELDVPEPQPLPDAAGPLDDLAAAQSLEEVRQAAAALKDALTARGVI